MKKILGLLFLTSCTVGPHYEHPEHNLGLQGDSFFSQEGVYCEDPPHDSWWEVFEDPLLSHYIDLAREQNNDFLRASVAIYEARSLRQMVASNFFPQFSMDLSALKTYFSKNGPAFSLAPEGGAGGGIPSASTGIPFSIQSPQIQNLFNVLVDASWEIDFFGKTRRAVEAADAQIESSIEKSKDVLLTLYAEVARTYLDLRALQEKTELVTEQIALLEEIKTIREEQYRQGYLAKPPVEEAESDLVLAKALLPTLHRETYRDIISLARLTGNLPEALVDELLPQKPLPQLPKNVAVGLRSDLLRRRPDVRQAERELALATALVGVATASFYPSFSLLGDAGLQSLAVKNLFEAASKTWAYGADFNMPLFQGGKLIGQYHMTEARMCMAGFHYQQVILTALSEVEGALISYLDDLLQMQHDSKSSELLGNRSSIVDSCYEEGLYSRLEALNAKKSYLQARILVVEGSSKAFEDLVRLYKALGGGVKI